MKRVFILLLAALLLCGCTTTKTTAKPADAAPEEATVPEAEEVKLESSEDTNMQSNPIATIIMKDGGVIKVELYPEKAGNTVCNFISLANSGFYDGLIFHRVISGFMIQGGDPTGTGMGGPGYSIKGEFAENGFTANDISHKRGVISMARSRSMDSAGSQFFIMHAAAPYLDRQYAAFGMVTEGMEVVDAIASTKTDYNDRPYEDQVIDTIRVETFGVTYAEPVHVN